jgi:hypothetical protein
MFFFFCFFKHYFDTKQTSLFSLSRSITANPAQTTLRVNTLAIRREELHAKLQEFLSSKESTSKYKVEAGIFPDELVIRSNPPHDLSFLSDTPQVIVDPACARAVLRGADVFFPGVSIFFEPIFPKNYCFLKCSLLSSPPPTFCICKGVIGCEREVSVGKKVIVVCDLKKNARKGWVKPLPLLLGKETEGNPGLCVGIGISKLNRDDVNKVFL